MTQDRGRSAWRRVVDHPSGILLAVQVLGVLAYPYMEDSAVGKVAFEAFGALVLTLAVFSVRKSRTPTWVVIILAVTASGLSIATSVHPNAAVQLTAAVLHAVFYFAAAASLIVYMLEDDRVTADELFAVGATFTLVAWAFAYVFTAAQLIEPGCFIAAVNSGAPRTWTELLFLSFTNLTSTGIGDVVPVTGHARSYVMLAQLSGVGYVALIVSRLVGLTLSRRATADGKTGAARDASADRSR